jgi:hypothetical protein
MRTVPLGSTVPSPIVILSGELRYESASASGVSVGSSSEGLRELSEASADVRVGMRHSSLELRFGSK